MTLHADPAAFWSESNTQIAIVKFLRVALPPFYKVLSFPNGRFKADPRTIERLKREGLLPGAPDLIILRNDGWAALMEVKAGKGKLSEAQNEFSAWWTAGGGEFAVVRSLDEAEVALRSWNVPLRARAT